MRILSFVLLASASLASLSAAAVTCVQHNYATPQSSQTTVTVPFKAAQIAGDLNVVVVGWNDSTAAVRKVTDSRGNAYTLAVGPTVQIGMASQSVYYAKNIAAAAAGANTVTITFNVPATFADVRVLEYTGVDPKNPVDVTAANFGNNASSSSGSAATTNATDLIFSANLVRTTTSGPGGSFTQRLLTSPDGDIAEDKTVSAKGSYSASAPLGSPGPWIMQMVAFRASSNTGTPASPTHSVDLTWTGSTSPNVVGYSVYRATGTSAEYSQIATGVVNPTYADDSVTSGSTYTYVVNAVDNLGDESAYSNAVTVSIP
jgi:hypothetical protein